MNPIAIYSGTSIVYWSSIVILMGMLACLCLSLSMQKANGGKCSALLLFFVLAIVLSVPLCRILHWYCHIEQYNGFFGAITDYSTGSYCLPGAFIAAWISAFIVSKLGLQKSRAKLLDAVAPGAALLVAFIRLSSLFNSSCRSKIIVTAPLLQRLPIASGLVNSSGAMEYRFATFFVQFIIMLFVAWSVLQFFCKRRSIEFKYGSEDGNTARYFLLLCCAVELLMDSTRYDSSFMKFNGFISIVQIFCALSIVGLLVFFSILSIRANGKQSYHWLLWIGFFLMIAGVGVSEYLVQRYGDLYLVCYTAMGICCVLMAVLVYKMYQSCCIEYYDD